MKSHQNPPQVLNRVIIVPHLSPMQLDRYFYIEGGTLSSAYRSNSEWTQLILLRRKTTLTSLQPHHSINTTSSFLSNHHHPIPNELQC